MIIPATYENLQVTHEGTMSKRAYVIKKMGGMYKLNIFGYIIAALGRVGVMVGGYMGNLPLMLAFTAVSTIGIAPLQGDLNALIACCSEYTTLKTG